MSRWEGPPRQYYEVPRLKRPQTNPKVLAKAEVRDLLLGTDNPKHRAMLMLAYGLALRLGEVLALTSADIDAKRMALYVRAGKGKKDRDLPARKPAATAAGAAPAVSARELSF